MYCTHIYAHVHVMSGTHIYKLYREQPFRCGGQGLGYSLSADEHTSQYDTATRPAYERGVSAYGRYAPVCATVSCMRILWLLGRPIAASLVQLLMCGCTIRYQGPDVDS